MKNAKSVITSIVMMLLFSVSVIAQSEAKVIAVVNKADWCPVCKENGPRAMKTLKSNNADGAVQFIMNDLTNEKTKKNSAMKLKKHDLYKKMKPFKSTGIVYFFNAETKKLIKKISVKKSNDKLKEALLSSKNEV
jgi:thiol:disulfide interchange protein